MFSVAVIPTLNEAHGIEDSFFGLSNQTKPPDHIIVSDGGSTDGTVAKARELGEAVSIPTTVGERPDSNIGLSCEAGVFMAGDEIEKRGSDGLVVRTDADSILSPEWIERANAYVERGSPPAMFGGVTFPKHMLGSAPHTDESVSGWMYSAMSNMSINPKGRGMAFKWSDFQDVGGYCLCAGDHCDCSPDWYEDSILVTKYREEGGDVTMSRRAPIYTEMPTTTLSSPTQWLKSREAKNRVRRSAWKPSV